MSETLLCSHDGCNLAQFLCICTFPSTLICSEHREKHLLMPLSQGITHFITSVAAFNIVSDRSKRREHKDKGIKLKERQYEISEAVLSIIRRQKEITTEHFDSTIKLLNQRREEFNDFFTMFEETVKKMISEAAEEISMHAFDSEYTPSAQLGELLWSSESEYCNVLEFKMDVSEIQIDRFVTVEVRSRIKEFKDLGGMIQNKRGSTDVTLSQPQGQALITDNIHTDPLLESIQSERQSEGEYGKSPQTPEPRFIDSPEISTNPYTSKLPTIGKRTPSMPHASRENQGRSSRIPQVGLFSATNLGKTGKLDEQGTTKSMRNIKEWNERGRGRTNTWAKTKITK